MVSRVKRALVVLVTTWCVWAVIPRLVLWVDRMPGGVAVRALSGDKKRREGKGSVEERGVYNGGGGEWEVGDGYRQK